MYQVTWDGGSILCSQNQNGSGSSYKGIIGFCFGACSLVYAYTSKLGIYNLIITEANRTDISGSELLETPLRGPQGVMPGTDATGVLMQQG